MSVERNMEVVRNHHAKINSGNYKEALLDFVEDARNHGIAVGRAGFALVFADLFRQFSNFRMDIVDLVASGDTVAARVMSSGTHDGQGNFPVPGLPLYGIPPTGKHHEVQHIHWYKLKDGKIIEHYANRDDIGMLQQLGLMAAPPPPAKANF